MHIISTLRWAVLTVLWIGFRHIGPISLCVDLFVFICVYFVCFCFILHSCCIIVSMMGWTWWDWNLILGTYLPSVHWHCWLGHLTRKNPVSDMTYDVWWDIKPCSIYLTLHQNQAHLSFKISDQQCPQGLLLVRHSCPHTAKTRTDKGWWDCVDGCITTEILRQHLQRQDTLDQNST